MTHALVTVSGGITDQVSFFDSELEAIGALMDFVKGMNPQEEDAAVFGPKGLIANAKDFLDENDQFDEQNHRIEEFTSDGDKPHCIYLIGNPVHRLGFMVASPDDPLGFKNPAEAVSELGQMRKDVGPHLKLYRVVPVEEPIVTRAEVEKYNAEIEVEDFAFGLVGEYVTE